jgi:hypothetical protein
LVVVVVERVQIAVFVVAKDPLASITSKYNIKKSQREDEKKKKR